MPQITKGIKSILKFKKEMWTNQMSPPVSKRTTLSDQVRKKIILTVTGLEKHIPKYTIFYLFERPENTSGNLVFNFMTRNESSDRERILK